MHHTNATLDEVHCSGPALHQGKKLNELLPHSFDCITAGVVVRRQATAFIVLMLFPRCVSFLISLSRRVHTFQSLPLISL